MAEGRAATTIEGVAPGTAPALSPDDQVAARRGEGPFVERVVSFTPGAGAGFGSESMPWVVLGGPRGEGALRGSTDVVSLGAGGSIVLAFDALPIVDGEGADFTVFENAFRYGPGQSRTYAEFAQVFVSDDGATWLPFPCDRVSGAGCAGRLPVYANVEANALSCLEPLVSGGDVFDLADVGLRTARFLRIEDRETFAPVDGDGKAGFDLDAVAAIHRAAAP